MGGIYPLLHNDRIHNLRKVQLFQYPGKRDYEPGLIWIPMNFTSHFLYEILRLNEPFLGCRRLRARPNSFGLKYFAKNGKNYLPPSQKVRLFIVMSRDVGSGAMVVWEADWGSLNDSSRPIAKPNSSTLTDQMVQRLQNEDFRYGEIVAHVNEHLRSYLHAPDGLEADAFVALLTDVVTSEAWEFLSREEVIMRSLLRICIRQLSCRPGISDDELVMTRKLLPEASLGDTLTQQYAKTISELLS